MVLYFLVYHAVLQNCTPKLLYPIVEIDRQCVAFFFSR